MAAAAAAVSPSSSPRLPSPPPIAEDQVGPTSPGVQLFDDHGRLPSVTTLDAGASRRIRPGTKAEDMAEGPALVELSEIDSPFQLTEHLKALYYARTHPEKSSMTQALTAQAAREIVHPPPQTSREIWLYELGRLLIDKTNAIIVALFADSPPCSMSTCPEMRASEWQYLCAVHEPPRPCAAIDYCCHTLDWAATTLTSSKTFPSRLNLGSGGTGGAGDKLLAVQMKDLKNVFRRVYRIYAHAWFQHREMFWRVEGRTGLYTLFKMVCDEYNIIEPENYTIPPEAEGGESAQTPSLPQNAAVNILRRDDSKASRLDEASDAASHSMIAPTETTKRHRHTMSSSSISLSTPIEEENEEEELSEQQPAKPVLGRSETAVKGLETLVNVEDSPDSKALGSMNDQAMESDPGTGITRTETIRPATPSLDPDEHIAEHTPDVTVVEISPDDHEPISPEIELSSAAATVETLATENDTEEESTSAATEQVAVPIATTTSEDKADE